MSNFHPSQPFGGPYGYANNGTQQNPAQRYPPQYMPPNNGVPIQPQGHINTNFDGFAFNNTVATFAQPPVAPGMQQLPAFQIWNHGQMTLPPYSAPQDASQYTEYHSGQQNMQYYSTPNAPPQASSHVEARGENADFSEGEFDDSATTATGIPLGYGPARHHYSHKSGFGDNTPRDAYSRSQDYSSQRGSDAVNNNSSWSQNRPPRVGRQSNSYSPIDDVSSYPAARLGTGLPVTASSRRQGEDESQSQKTPRQQIMAKVSWTPTVMNGTHNATLPEQHPAVGGNRPQTLNPEVAIRKEDARRAIIALLAHNVKFQTYVDEGVSEDILRPLFHDLKLPTTFPRLKENVRDAEATKASRASAISGQAHSSTPINGKSENDNKSRHVRKNYEPEGVSATDPGVAPEPQPKALTDKERTLQAKMEALRKSREERAQKVAAAKTEKLLIPHSAKAPQESVTATGLASALVPGTAVSISQHVVPTSAALQPPPMATGETAQSSHIPGLFLGASSYSPAPSAPVSTVYGMPITNTRKRPVASDFDQYMPAVATTVKRPFGQSRKETSLVIDVSDDEDDVEAMDLDSAVKQDSSTFQQQRGANPHLSSLSSFPARSFSTPVSASHTPSILHPIVRSTIRGPLELQQKEIEIEKLKRRIREREEAARATQPTSGNQTPISIDAGNLAGGFTQSTSITPRNDSEAQVPVNSNPRPEGRQVHAQTPHLEVIEPVRTLQPHEANGRDSERIRLRREQIANEVPRIETELQASQRKLEEMRLEIARIEADVQKKLEEKEKFATEMARLVLEAEVHAHEQQGKPELLIRYDELGINGPEPQPILNRESLSVGSDTQPPTSAPQPRSSPRIEEQGLAVHQSPHLTVAQHDDSDVGGVELESPIGSTIAPPSIADAAAGDRALEAALQEAVRIETESHDQQDEDVDMDLSGTPDQLETHNELTNAEHHSTQRSPSYSPDLEKSVPFTGEDSKTHEPHATQNQDADDYEPSLGKGLEMLESAGEVSELEADLYGADVQEGSSMAHAVIESPSDDYEPFAESEPEPVEAEDDGAAVNLVVPSAVHNLAEVFKPAAAQEENDYEPPEAFVDLAPPPRPTESSSLEASNQEQPRRHTKAPIRDSFKPQTVLAEAKALGIASTDNSAVVPTERFTPYESPLRQFRAYRFHPDFSNEVPGGLRSLTFSHKIDPRNEFCQFELAGGACNDSTCDMQHFRDIKLPDEGILTALGSPEDFKHDPAQQEAFIEGLRTVLKNVRGQKLRDFQLIASEILAHRTRFLNDPSKVLPLHGVPL